MLLLKLQTRFLHQLNEASFDYSEKLKNSSNLRGSYSIAYFIQWDKSKEGKDYQQDDSDICAKYHEVYTEDIKKTHLQPDTGECNAKVKEHQNNDPGKCTRGVV